MFYYWFIIVDCDGLWLVFREKIKICLISLLVVWVNFGGKGMELGWISRWISRIELWIKNLGLKFGLDLVDK